MVRKLLFIQVIALLCSAAYLSAEPTSKTRLNIVSTQIMSSKTYDSRNVLQVINAGTLVGVEEGHQVTLSAIAYCTEGPDVGKNKRAIVRYSLSGRDASLYELANDSLVLTCDILPFQVTASGVDVEIVKMVDGNAEAVISQQPRMNPVVGRDVITLRVSASFEDALPGVDKTVTLHYSIAGDNVKNYVAPADSLFTRHGKILEYITIDGQDGGNAFTDATAGWCQETTSILSFKTLTGDPIEYSVKFSDEAKAQGFEDIEWEEVIDGNKVLIDIPMDCKDGVYNATICLRNELGFSTDPIAATVKVLVNSNTVIALFSNVVAVDDIYGNYRTYQWYKNGERIVGANRQFYQDPDGLNGLYYVVINEGEIDEYITCEKQFVTESEPAKIRKEIREGRMFVVMPDGTEFDVEGRRAK